MKKNYFSIFLLLFPLLLKAQWTSLNLNTGYENFAVSFISMDTGYISGGIWQGPPPGVNSTYLYRTTNGGQSFVPIFENNGNTPIHHMKFFSLNRGVVKRWQDCLRTTNDGGLTFKDHFMGGNTGSSFGFQAMDSLNYIYMSDSTFRYTYNGGISWNKKNIAPLAAEPPVNNYSAAQFYNWQHGFISEIIFHPGGAAYWETKLFATHDSCKTFKLCYRYNFKKDQPIDNPVIRTFSASTAVMLVDKEILHTKDFGETWDTVYTHPTTAFYFMDVKNNVVIAGGASDNLVLSKDGGKTFTAIPVSGASTSIRDVCIASVEPLIIYVTGPNGILYKSETITTVPDQYKSAASITVYPNPFQNNVNVSIALQEPSKVRAEIYSVLGEKLQSKESMYMQSGNYVISIDLSDIETVEGIYFLKLVIGNKTYVNKIVKAEN